MKAALDWVRQKSELYSVEVEFGSGVKKVYAGGPRERRPLHLIATCGTSLPGEWRTRYRHDMVAGAIVRRTYTLEQPVMHSIYRSKFNAVDLFNRDAMGPLSVQHAVKTRSWYRRLFMAVVGMSHPNAVLAYRRSKGGGPKL